MCIRDSYKGLPAESVYHSTCGGQTEAAQDVWGNHVDYLQSCLLYTSDAADERSSVDLGGRRIIKKKTKHRQIDHSNTTTTDNNKTRYKRHKEHISYKY